MDTEKECPICYETYGNGIPMFGKTEVYETDCKHYFCDDCCYQLSRKARYEPVYCPFCRDDWTEFLWEYYINQSDYSYSDCGCCRCCGCSDLESEIEIESEDESEVDELDLIENIHNWMSEYF